MWSEMLALEPFVGGHDEVGRLQREQIVYHLMALSHKLSLLVSVFLQFERPNVFYLILAYHLFRSLYAYHLLFVL